METPLRKLAQDSTWLLFQNLTTSPQWIRGPLEPREIQLSLCASGCEEGCCLPSDCCLSWPGEHHNWNGNWQKKYRHSSGAAEAIILATSAPAFGSLSASCCTSRVPGRWDYPSLFTFIARIGRHPPSFILPRPRGASVSFAPHPTKGDGGELSACSHPFPRMLMHIQTPFSDPQTPIPTSRLCCPTYLRLPAGCLWLAELLPKIRSREARSDLLPCTEGSYELHPTQLLITRIDEPLMSFTLMSSQINAQHVAGRGGGISRTTGKIHGGGRDEAPRAWAGVLAKGLVQKIFGEDGHPFVSFLCFSTSLPQHGQICDSAAPWRGQGRTGLTMLSPARFLADGGSGFRCWKGEAEGEGYLSIGIYSSLGEGRSHMF